MSGMETDETATTDEAGHDIGLVLGELTDEQRAAVEQQLDAAGAKLADLTAKLTERSGRDTCGARDEIAATRNVT